MTLRRQRSLSPDKREQLFSAARGEFAAHGYEQASFNRIIRASGISKGSVYYHFADKSDLFVEIQREAFRSIGERLGPWPRVHDAEGYWASIRQKMAAFDEIAMHDPELAGIGRALYSGGDQSPAMITLRADAEAWVSGLLGQGLEVGAVRSDVPLSFLARALTAMVIGLDRWFIENWQSIDPAQLESLSDATLQLMRDLVQGVG